MGNEFQQPGESRQPDAGEKNVGRLREDVHFDQRDSVSVGSVDATRAAAEAKNGPTKDWMSMAENPKGFQEKTEALLKLPPEGKREAIANNETAAESVKAYIASIEAKIKAVMTAQATHDRLNTRMA